MEKIPHYKEEIPAITTDQMIEVDRLMIEEYKIQLIQMMENAGRCLAIVAVDQFLKVTLKSKEVIVLAGTGGNGGGALVCARRLHNWGAKVRVFLSGRLEKMTPIPLHQLRILQRMGVQVFSGNRLLGDKTEGHLLIDGMIGYSIKGAPLGLVKEMILWANEQSIPTLALDTPSGIDLTSGKVSDPTIKAAATLTLALPKKGLFMENVISYRGDLFLGDISVPPQLYAERSLALKVNPYLFAQSDVLQL